jgi:hypothetical protein
VYRLANNGDGVAFKMGRKAVRADWRKEGAYLNRSVTDEQRGRPPIFNAALRAAAGWLFFRVARSLRIDLDMLVARAVKNNQLTCGDVIIICETVHWPNIMVVWLEERTLGVGRSSFVFALPAGNASTNKWQRDAAIA